MPAIGASKIDGVTIGELSADFTKTTIRLTAKAAYIDTEAGVTRGWTSGDGTLWSKETIDKLDELRELMEKDFFRRDFTQADDAAVAQSGPTPTGLGEHLSPGETTPQV